MRLLALILVALALPIASASGQSHDPKYWIYLDASGADDGAAETSARALKRRAARGRAGARPVWDRPISEARLNELRQLGVRPVHRSKWLRAISAHLSPEQRETVEDLPFVVAVRRVAAGTQTTNTSSFSPELPPAPSALLDYGPSRTQLEIVNAIPLMEARGLTGHGVILGVIDTGAGDLSQPSVAHIVEEGRLLGREDFSGQPEDFNRHALCVLSAAAGREDGALIGPAHDASVLLARSEYAPTETNQEEDAFVAAMEWMEAQGADVVNVSLGYYGFDAGERSYTPADMNGVTSPVTIAADRAVQLGVTVVTSAGNEGCSSPDACWYYIGAPADGFDVITVGGVNADRSRYTNSSYGPTADGRIKPDVAAQGTGVVCSRSNGGIRYASGTSLSAPLVSGVVALLLEARPLLQPHEIGQALRSTASQAAAPDHSLGWGIVDAVQALAYIEAFGLGTDTPSPDTDTLPVLFPNPTSGALSVGLPATAGRTRIDIFDATGRMVMTQASAESLRLVRIQLPPDLPSGVFLYQVESDTGTWRGRFVHIR